MKTSQLFPSIKGDTTGVLVLSAMLTKNTHMNPFYKAYAILYIYLLHAKSTIFDVVCKHLCTQTPSTIKQTETASRLRTE